MPEEEAKKIVQEFLSGTPAWYTAFKRGYDTSKGCVMCGIVPDKMNELRNALIILKVKH